VGHPVPIKISDFHYRSGLNLDCDEQRTDACYIDWPSVMICNESVGKPQIYNFRVRKLLILLDAKLRKTTFLDFSDRFNGIVEFQNI
jgi:hypothetical protein